MARYIFKLPDIGEGTAEAELVAWHVAVGDAVEEDQPLADVMTDKATVEITSPVGGTVAALHGTVGALAQVGSPLVEFESDVEIADGETTEDSAPTIESIAADLPPVTFADTERPPERVKASPAVRQRAKLAGIPLEQLRPSDPNGRVRQHDLDAYIAYGGGSAEGNLALPATATVNTNAPVIAASGYREVTLVGLRRRIAEKMEISTRRIPHFSYIEEADLTDLEEVRGRLNDRYSGTRAKLSVLPFIVRALCRILPDFPQMNATYDEDTRTARYYTPVHIGIATQTDNGLMVAVLRDAAGLGLWETAQEISRLAKAARDGTAKREDLSGSTLTVTSLGTLGGVATTPVINHPEVAIVGPNKIVERPVAYRGGISLRKIMNISSSFDHRVVDGQEAARFIQALKDMLEDPSILLAS